MSTQPVPTLASLEDRLDDLRVYDVVNPGSMRTTQLAWQLNRDARRASAYARANYRPRYQAVAAGAMELLS